MSFLVYEDAALVVVDKPAGLSSEEGVPARLRQLWDAPDAYVGVIHRLDVGVSGLMVYAKTPRGNPPRPLSSSNTGRSLQAARTKPSLPRACCGTISSRTAAKAGSSR